MLLRERHGLQQRAGKLCGLWQLHAHSVTAGLGRPDLVVVGEVAVHVRNVLTGHFFDDQSAVIGDKEAAIAAFGFAWRASSKGYLETDKEQARSTSFHPI